MKKIIFFITALSIMLLLASCGEAQSSQTQEMSSEEKIESSQIQQNTESSADDSETETLSKETDPNTEIETESKEIYTDLSAVNSPTVEKDDKNNITISSEPKTDALTTTLRFDLNESNYSLSVLDISGIHNSTMCGECGYREFNGELAYYICQNAENQGGLLITLKDPIDSSLISGVSATYATSEQVTSSQLRVLRKDANGNGAFVNTCPSMAGAVGEWKTVDLGLDTADIKKLADGDGKISAFKIYFRNKDNTDIYIKDIKFTISSLSLCKVDGINENCFYRGQAIDHIAKEMARRFSSLGIDVDLSIKASSYTANTPASLGKITYNVKLTYPDGSSESHKALNAAICPISDHWLEISDGPYGVERDSKDQWKTNFDKGGIITLNDNTFVCADELLTVEYAVIDVNANVTDPQIIWHAPQSLTLNDKGFSLYINAFLDYGDKLIEGDQYRFVVRDVTVNGNFALHLDIPFTYSVHSESASSALLNALEKVEKVSFSAEKTSDIEAFVKSEIEKLVNDDKIGIDTCITTDGMLSAKVKVRISYLADTPEQRFPTYRGDRSDFYAYFGDAFTVEIPVRYGEQTSSLVLVAPEDGKNNIIIASQYVVEHMRANFDHLTSRIYPFVREERCLPLPVTLSWEDKDGSNKYTVKISENEDMTDHIIISSSETSIDVYNLKAGTKYFWQVMSGEITSATFCFTTATHPRFIRTENVSNFRDIGGYTTVDGKKVKQGVAYRSAQLEAVNSNDIKIITEDLGIKTDLDLRGQSMVSPLGESVNVIPISIQWYVDILQEEHNEAVRQAIAEFACKDNYPMVYHCAIGRDRTGTVTMLILGLLGVDEETLIREYLLSFQAVSGNDGTNSKDMVNQAKGFLDSLKRYADEGATLQEQTKGFLLHIGVTEEQIRSIREILLED